VTNAYKYRTFCRFSTVSWFLDNRNSDHPAHHFSSPEHLMTFKNARMRHCCHHELLSTYPNFRLLTFWIWLIQISITHFPRSSIKQVFHTLVRNKRYLPDWNRQAPLITTKRHAKQTYSLWKGLLHTLDVQPCSILARPLCYAQKMYVLVSETTVCF
jgi:hypothetical protein